GRGAAARSTATGRRGNPQASGVPSAPGQRFQPLNVQADANGASLLDVAPAAQETEDVGRLLPAGFSLENAQADAIAISGSTAAANLDRALMSDRFQMVNLGQLDPATGEFAPGFGPRDGGFQGPAGFGRGPAGGDGRGGPPFPAGFGGGPGGRGGFVLGGRSGRGQ